MRRSRFGAVSTQSGPGFLIGASQRFGYAAENDARNDAMNPRMIHAISVQRTIVLHEPSERVKLELMPLANPSETLGADHQPLISTD